MPEFEKFLARERYRTRTEEIAAIFRTNRRAYSRCERKLKRARRARLFAIAAAAVVMAALLTQNARSDVRKGKDTTGGLLATQTQETAFTEPEIIEPQLVSLGQFRITHYCACEKCCGKTDGITATGTTATAGRTIAVDPDVIPYGSEVALFYDDGRICYYVAEDCGGAIKGNDIDVFVDSHEEALELGVTGASVYLVNEVKG